MPCSLLEVNQRFEGTYQLHFQSRRISQARSQTESRWQDLLTYLQSAYKNFGLYRKKEGNSRQKISSRWLACSTEWTVSIHWLYTQPSETIEDNNWIIQKKIKEIVYRKSVPVGSPVVQNEPSVSIGSYTQPSEPIEDKNWITSLSLRRYGRAGVGKDEREFMQEYWAGRRLRLPLLSRCFIVWLILQRWRWYGPPKLRLTLNDLQGFVSQKIEPFVITAVRTTNPTLKVSYISRQPVYYNGSLLWLILPTLNCKPLWG
jgi:hypothetical protein